VHDAGSVTKLNGRSRSMTYVLAYTAEKGSAFVGLGEKLVTVHWLLMVT